MIVRPTWLLAIVVALLAMEGCKKPAPTLETREAGPVTKTIAACPPEEGETCGACIAQMGTCCYDDPSIGGTAAMLVDRCEGMPSCRACCNECAARSCDEWTAKDQCPNK